MARVAAPHMIGELEGLRALARSLAGADGDDLVQDAAIAAIEHPPPDDGRPLRPWLFTVLRNRWRMDRRAARRRLARDAAEVAGEPDAAIDRSGPDALLDRARMLERLAAALVGLEDPFREAVILRYLDGRSAADIARALGVPDGTVRWRIKTGLDRLRDALDREAPRPVWQRALIGAPLGLGAGASGGAGAAAKILGAGAVMKSKSTIVIALVLLLIGGGVVAWRLLDDRPDRGPRAAEPAKVAHGNPPPAGAPGTGPAAARPGPAADVGAAEPSPGQGRATVEKIANLRGGAFRGRVINWSTGDGVEAAELTFASAGGDVITVRSAAGGGFELAPPQPAAYTLATVEAAGYMPYAPEWQHSSVRLTARADERVAGLVVYLFPAVDYNGLVVDGKDRPVAGARIRLVGSPTGEQTLASLETSWVSGRDGRFVFHATDDSVLEAEARGLRGRARLDGNVAITHHMVIKLGDLPRDPATVSGHVVGADGIGIPGALVRAVPVPQSSERKPGGMVEHSEHRAVAFATTDADGSFVLRELDGLWYELIASADGLAPTTQRVAGNQDGVRLELGRGQVLRGKVVDAAGAPVPAFTLLVFERRGIARDLVEARTIVDGGGQFAVHVAGAGEHELMASATGLAPSPYTPARPDAPTTLTLPGGATVRGVVVTAGKNTPIKWARVMVETARGGASATPANPGTVTREDGTFELTGIPPGPLSLTIAAGEHHPRIEAGLQASDGASLGPITIVLTPLAPGEQPTLELVGIGVAMGADGDGLRVQRVIPGGGAEAAGIVAGDLIIAVDGNPVTTLGFDAAIGRIRGAPGTRVRLTLVRDGAPLDLEVERRAIRA